jgi:hypothetical protein
MKEALKKVSDLLERFERNIEAYRSPAYNETQLRREFIDPFFEALGWDVTNKAGYSEQYKDVTVCNVGHMTWQLESGRGNKVIKFWRYLMEDMVDNLTIKGITQEEADV